MTDAALMHREFYTWNSPKNQKKSNLITKMTKIITQDYRIKNTKTNIHRKV